MVRKLSAKLLAFSLGFTLFSYLTNSSLSKQSLSLQPAYQDIAKLVGGNWEHQAQILIGLVSMAATNPNYCQ